MIRLCLNPFVYVFMFMCVSNCPTFIFNIRFDNKSIKSDQTNERYVPNSGFV